MRLRQLVLVAADLEPLARSLQEILLLGEGYRDPGVGEFGLHNVVFPVGDQFLEIVSPRQAGGGTAAGRYLERRGGDGGYMVIFQTEDLDEFRRRLPELDVRVVWQADLDTISGTHLHPKDVGGAIVSVDEARPPESWHWAGDDWPQRVRSDGVTGCVGAEIESPDPMELAARWADVLDLDPADVDQLELRLDDAFLRFVPCRDHDETGGLAAIHLRAADPEGIRERALADRMAWRLEASSEEGGFELGGVRFVLHR